MYRWAGRQLKLEEGCQEENIYECPLREDENLGSNSSSGVARKGVAEVELLFTRAESLFNPLSEFDSYPKEYLSLPFLPIVHDYILPLLLCF